MLVPRVFRETAPFEMKKAADTGCLCIHCEGMNELRRESKGAASQIEAILQRTKHTLNASMTAQLGRIKFIISMPSKYESIVECLGPCLPSGGKLEVVKYSCINGSECPKYGFRQLWSVQLRQKLLKDNGEQRWNTVLTGAEWQDKNIAWRHYT